MRFHMFIVSMVYLILSSPKAEGNDDAHGKRILLSDPSFLDQRLSHLESLVQKQALDISAMETLIKEQSANITASNLLIQQQAALIQNQAAQLTSMGTSINQQASNISSVESIVQKQSLHISSLENQRTIPAGAIFTRWGKLTCPKNTSMVYSGFTASGKYNEKGGSTEYICLTRDAVNGPVAGASGVNKIYGTEYQSNFWKSDSYNEDAPCIVCQAPVHSTVMVLPGRDTCYNGWTLQYNGNLASGNYLDEAKYEYACLDKDPDYLSGGIKDTNGALFYPVVAKCGALQCPPYKDGHVVMCAVCTQ